MVTMATPTPIPRQNSPLTAKTPAPPGAAGVLERRRLAGQSRLRHRAATRLLLAGHGAGDGRLLPLVLVPQAGMPAVRPAATARGSGRRHGAGAARAGLDGEPVFLKGLNWHEETACNGRSMTGNVQRSQLPFGGAGLRGGGDHDGHRQRGQYRGGEGEGMAESSRVSSFDMRPEAAGSPAIHGIVRYFCEHRSRHGLSSLARTWNPAAAPTSRRGGRRTSFRGTPRSPRSHPRGRIPTPSPHRRGRRRWR
ncbi:hypothetical protein M2303_004426 [Micromonospora sp. H404/HB375]|nr:hypothetical protein [Micromonospora sp. H404/HB375]